MNNEHNATGEELRHSRPLDVHVWSEHPEVNSLVNAIYEDHFTGYSGNVSVAKKHVKVILLDLYVAWKNDPDLKISYHRNSNRYKRGRYNKLHISRLTPKIVDLLVEVGLLHNRNGIYNEFSGGPSFTARMWPTDKLRKMFVEARFGELNISRHPDQEHIILRDDARRDIDYNDNDSTSLMRTHLEEYQALLDRTYIDIPTMTFSKIEAGMDRLGNAQYIYLRQGDKFVRRIFNRSSFDKGGRFYGGWWQRCPSEDREQIFMDDYPTSEIDYSGLHLVILYAKEGIDYWSTVDVDPYSIDRPEWLSASIDLRQLCKSLILVAINASDENSTFRAFRDNAANGSKEKKLNDDRLREILNTLKDSHKPIAPYFASGAGINLMRMDSDITEEIIRHFTENEIPVLTVHDSYIVPDGCEMMLEDSMRSAFAKITGIDGVRLKEVTVHPEAYEPLSLEDSYGIDTRLVQKDIERRHNPCRSERYNVYWDEFKELLDKPAIPTWKIEHAGPSELL